MHCGAHLKKFSVNFFFLFNFSILLTFFGSQGMHGNGFPCGGQGPQAGGQGPQAGGQHGLQDIPKTFYFSH